MGFRGDTGVQMKDLHHRSFLGSRMELRRGTMSRALGALAGRVGARNRTEAEAQVSTGQQEREYGSS